MTIELASIVGGDDTEAHAYLNWLHLATARTMYAATRFREQVEALMGELLTREVVGRRRAREILDAGYATNKGAQVVARSRS